MGRPKGSRNKVKDEASPNKNIKIKQEKPENVKPEPKVKIAVPTPLMDPLFLCRRCEGSFESKDEYAQHNCPFQVYEVAEVTDEVQGEIIAELDPIVAEPESLSPLKKSRKTRKLKEKSPKLKKIKTEKEQSAEPISCEKCKKVFTRKYHLERHLIHTKCNEGKIERQELSCQVCGKIFTRIDNLRMHLKGHLGQKTRNRDFACPYCEKCFYGSSLLNIHIRTHTREKPYLCDWTDCGKGFPSSGALTKHRRVHTGERPYQCTVCQARFSAKETLNRHVRTHTGRKDHVCKICGKAFIQNTQLKAHMFHHNGENALTCDICAKQFNRKTRLREHIDYIHLKKQMPQCLMCKKEFMRKEDLSRHMEIHVGKRVHECNHPGCEKKFVTKAAVKIHMRIHQVEPPSRCSICTKDFIRLDCLVRHMRSKHRDMLHNITMDSETKKVYNIKRDDMNNEEIEIIYYGDEAQITSDQVFEIIPVDDVTLQDQKPKIKLAESSSIAKQSSAEEKPVESDDEEGAPIFLDDKLLMTRISELLQIVIEESLLKELGFGKKPVDDVLCSVLEQCSRKPLRKGFGADDDSTRMRENTKQLFSMVLDEEHIKSLLNNYTVDEVITIVLKMSK